MEQEIKKYLYTLKNNLKVIGRKYIYDDPCLPIIISQKEEEYYYGLFWGNTRYLFIEGNETCDITKIRFNSGSGILETLTIVDSRQITFHEDFFTTEQYIQIKSCIAITIANFLPDKEKDEVAQKYVYLSGTSKIHVFMNAIVILIVEDMSPRYFLHEEYFGVLTDNNFVVIGFVIDNITTQNIQTLKEYIAQKTSRCPNQESSFPPCITEAKIMPNKYLIKKIMELENVDPWEIIYYGIDRRLIDHQFIIAYAEEVMSNNETVDQFTLEMGSLMPKEAEMVPKLFQARYKNWEQTMLERGQLYNKIWFYISVAADLGEAKVIR